MCDVRVKGVEGNRESGPSEKGIIDQCVCTAVGSQTMGLIDRAFEVNGGVRNEWSGFRCRNWSLVRCQLDSNPSEHFICDPASGGG